MRKIFIIEGVDKAGKTTLINVLSKKYPGYLIKVTDRPKDSTEVERSNIKLRYQKLGQLIAEERDVNFVLDRSFISELAYSKVMRGYDASEDTFFKGLESQMKGLGAILIYCDPGQRVLMKRHAIEPDDYIKAEQVKGLLKEYHQFYKFTILRKLKVDTSIPVDEIIKLIEKDNEY